MADDDAPPKKKGKLLIFIIAGVVVVLVIVAAGAFFLLKKKPAEDDEGDATHQETKAEHAVPPVYVKLETFTTNLAAEDSTNPQSGQYVQVVVELKVGAASDGDYLKQFMPEIRNSILRLLSNRRPSQLATAEGKDQLAQDMMDTVNDIIGPTPGKGNGKKKHKGPVSAVLFSSFIIQ
ncbi:MAG: flagellar basal body-associated FliL family protein [Proteobacteria bacterium]|nr:flagellar basal body-associated FliL family protein [Pseudomonadota bacterium]HQR05010.1 flagellar basal body-associated FliL family protein [Rhodocyclaceae bacterium]